MNQTSLDTEVDTEVANEATATERISRALLQLALYRHADSAGFVDIRAVIADSDLPEVVTRFLDLELRFSIARAIQPLTAQFRVDPRLSAPAVATLAEGILRTSTMAKEEFSTSFTNAIAIANAYLARPESTLSALLTNNEAETELDKRFFEILDHVGEYRYLPEIAKAWAERLRAHGVASVDEVALYRQFRKIDQGILGNYSLASLHRVVEPLYAFYGFGELTTISRDTLEDFFSDRGMSVARSVIAATGVEQLTLSEVVRLLESLVEANEQVSSGNRAIESEAEQPLPEQTAQTEKAHPEETEANQEENYAEFIHELRTAGVSILAPQLSRRPENILPSEKVVAESAPKVEPEPELLISVEKLIDSEARKKFVKKLFEGNTTDYHRYLAMIDQSESWKQASVYIDAIFLRHKVNPYSKSAIRFSDIVYSRFLRTRS